MSGIHSVEQTVETDFCINDRSGLIRKYMDQYLFIHSGVLTVL